MRKRRLVRRIRTTTASGLVPLLLLISVPACATRAHRSSIPAVLTDTQPLPRPLSRWSRVAALPTGAQIEVQLYDETAAIKGLVVSTTADTLTLTPDDGSSGLTRTLAQSDVQRVYTHRPIRERRLGWIILLGGMVGLATYFISLEDVSGPAGFLVSLLDGAVFAAPASLIGFLSQRKQQIYQGPPAALRLVTQVDVPVTDGDVIPRSLEAR